MNTTFKHMFHKTIVTSIFVFGFTTLAVMAQTTPNTQPPTTAAKPTASPTSAPAQIPSPPAVANQNPSAPVRIAPTPEPANGQVGNNPINTNQSIPNSQFMQSQNAVSTSQTGNGTPAGVGYNTPSGIVNSDAMQSAAVNQVHYHYHYDSAGQPIQNAPAGYAQTTYENPTQLNQSAAAMNMQSTSSGENSMYNYAITNDYGGMYTYQNNNWNPNSRVGNGGGAGITTTWNPYMGDGSGMLTYGARSGIEGFND
ncbi:MAG: hypothetical protein EXS12_01870 [Phycisphaerales bacterium]|nr:hypothetical protein [Phycisphaerales bacterium]